MKALLRGFSGPTAPLGRPFGHPVRVANEARGRDRQIRLSGLDRVGRPTHSHHWSRMTIDRASIVKRDPVGRRPSIVARTQSRQILLAARPPELPGQCPRWDSSPRTVREATPREAVRSLRRCPTSPAWCKLDARTRNTLWWIAARANSSFPRWQGPRGKAIRPETLRLEGRMVAQ